MLVVAVRAEQDIFNDLAALSASPGYAHAIAYLCFRDHVVGYGDTLKAEDCAKLFSFERLIRTEISTLIGLMVQAPYDLTRPDTETLESYIERTEILLKELHDALKEPAKAELRKARLRTPTRPKIAVPLPMRRLYESRSSTAPSLHTPFSIVTYPSKSMRATKSGSRNTRALHRKKRARLSPGLQNFRTTIC